MINPLPPILPARDGYDQQFVRNPSGPNRLGRTVCRRARRA